MIKVDISLQELQDKIGIRAKSAPVHRFWGLFVHAKKMEVLRVAYLEARKKNGAPGADGVSFHQIETRGRDVFLTEMQRSLETRLYSPGRYRKVDIPKGNGKTRTISIPNIRDRVVQGALKLVLEPIFEADFADTSFGARPGRSAHQAIDQVRKGMAYEKLYVVDVDLEGYFDNISHAEILSRVARRIQDPLMLAAIKAFLKSAGKRGVPQGSPLSPLVANLMLTDLDHAMHDARGFLFYVRYLDDMVVLAPTCRRGRLMAKRALTCIREKAEHIGVSLNLDKTRTVCMTDPDAAFDFLGFTFRWRESRTKGKWLAYREPQKRKVMHLYQNLRLRLSRAGHLSVSDAVKLLNPVIRGWVNYFRGGNAGRVFTKIRHTVELLVRRFAARQRGRRGR